MSERYSRQTRLAAIGPEGQRKLLDARVLVLGVGALGTVAAELLARAGVGFLRIVDRDTVEPSNLQRQSLFDERDAEAEVAKAAAAASHLSRINSEIEIEPIVADVVSQNVLELVDGIDLVVDATDNFPTRLLLNDVALRCALPWVHGGCIGSRGQVALFEGGSAPCFRCLVPELPSAGSVETCDTAGVLNAATHCIASLQVGEAIKHIVGAEPNRKLVSLDLQDLSFSTFELGSFARADCVACGQRKYEYLDGQVHSDPIVLCGRKAVQIAGCGDRTLVFDSVAERWSKVGEVQRSPHLLRLLLGEHTLTLFRDGRAVISGTEDVAVAKTLYARYVGQ